MGTYSIRSKKQSAINRLAQFLSTVTLGGLVAFATPAMAAENQSKSQEPGYSTGLTLGTLGAGIAFSSTTGWHLTDGDQIQWRAMVSGINGDHGDVEIADIDYVNSDTSIYSLQLGLDWYPVKSGWAKEIFVSGGAIYENGDFKGTAKTGRTYQLGSTVVNPGDITSLKTEIDNSQLMPYLSFGWGNKIQQASGFDFQAELGFIASTDDANVKIFADDATGILSSADIAAEAKDIRDELDGVSAFATIMVSYHF